MKPSTKEILIQTTPAELIGICFDANLTPESTATFLTHLLADELYADLRGDCHEETLKQIFYVYKTASIEKSSQMLTNYALAVLGHAILEVASNED